MLLKKFVNKFHQGRNVIMSGCAGERLVRADLGTDLVAAAVHPAEALELPARALLQQEHDLALRCKQGLALNLDFELIQIVELTS